MRTCILALLACFFAKNSSAQYFVNTNGKFESPDDLLGVPYYTAMDNIEGSPMLMEDWGNGTVRLYDGRVFKDVVLKFNLVSNELYFQRGTQIYAFKEPVKECELNYIDNSQVKKMFLRSGYPDYSNRNHLSLYEVLADGAKVQFLKYTYKKVKEEVRYSSNPVKSYELIVTYYIYDVAKNILTKVKPDKHSITEALPDYARVIESFANTSKSKFRSENETIALVNELNK